MIERASRRDTVPDPSARATLDALVRGRGLDRFAYFHVTGEGETFQNGMETTSGKVMDASGRVYRFWTAWDAERSTPTFRLWEPVESEPRWERSAADKRARAAVGLD